ncbi:MAG: DUF3795 domain-containing protein [Prolixibacteraceae bacterium]|nr:DUF3795 domain-containing protein [Prolixibacteraceae bacterium]MBN2775299.1 DUF3795 domain-containing protein [Prolixibacteraceae bacterium]
MKADNIEIKFNELAPCGIFCGACPSVNKTCLGCASNDKNQKRISKWACSIRICCYETKALDFCFECDEFPCKTYSKRLLTAHKSDPRFTYRFELPDLFKILKLNGPDSYYTFHKERWTCDDCGGTIRFYTYLCDGCRKYKLVN